MVRIGGAVSMLFALLGLAGCSLFSGVDDLGANAHESGGSAGTLSGGAAGVGGTGGTTGGGGWPTAGAGGTGGCSPGHDEDGDGLPDACDRCPTVSDPNDPDTDGDGVGNGCEHPVDPTFVGELTHFESFESAPPSGDWLLPASASFTNDAMVVDDTSCGGCSSTVEYYAQQQPPFAVEVRAVIPGAADGWVGVVASEVSAGALICYFHRTSQPTLEIWEVGSSAAKLVGKNVTESASASPTGTKRLRAFVTDHEIDCRFENEVGDTASLSYTSSATLGGAVGTRNYQTHAEYLSFSLYH